MQRVCFAWPTKDPGVEPASGRLYHRSTPLSSILAEKLLICSTFACTSYFDILSFKYCTSFAAHFRYDMTRFPPTPPTIENGHAPPLRKTWPRHCLKKFSIFNHLNSYVHPEESHPIFQKCFGGFEKRSARCLPYIHRQKILEDTNNNLYH